MAVRDTLVRLLEENRDKPLSGQELADRLGVTRAAIWKAVKALKAEGYAVAAGPNRGYRLEEDSDVLSEAGIRLHLPADMQHIPILVKKSVDSTNSALKRLAMDGAAAGTLLLAEEQTGGRGRRGRAFCSPAGTGLYLSMLLRPSRSLADFLPVTVAAAVAAARAMEAVSDAVPVVEWVNDVFIGGKKVCGILTEAVSDFESGMVEAVVVGVGINVRTPPEAFPPALRDIAGSLFPARAARVELAARLAAELAALAAEPGAPSVLAQYRRRCGTIGREVAFVQAGVRRAGRALDIDGEGRLVVQAGEERFRLRAGEVTMKRTAI